jgi:Ca2+/Na+ antiporter
MDVSPSNSAEKEGTAAGKVPPIPPPPRHGLLRRLLGWIAVGFLSLLIIGITLWSALAVYFSNTENGPRTIRAILIAIAMVAVILFVRPRRYSLLAFVLIFVGVVVWFFSLKETNDRDWSADNANVAWAQIDGDRITLHNVRNFDYRTETEFTPHWETRTYDLSKARSGDLMLVHWGSAAIAHAMISICFDDGQYLAVSIETRKEKAQTYSTVQGFFRQYGLIYIFADERDLIRLRTNYRKDEEVYLYRTTLTRAQVRSILLEYLQHANRLKENPEFYNALTSNCATNVWLNARESGLPAKLTWKLVLPGYLDSQGYENGRFDRSLPFEKLQAISHINAAARAAGDGPDFSEKIRVGLPDPVRQ